MSSAPSPQRRQEWENLLRTLRLRPSKALGQNFLVEPAVVDRIVDVAAVSQSDVILEIGPGLGILTQALAARAARVVAVELDAELASYLWRVHEHSDRICIVERDARYVEPSSLGLPAGYKVVANLPYSTATVILRRLFEQRPLPATLTVMVQREVSERMVARPPNMSLLSIATQLSATARIAFTVPPGAFSPPPQVESAVVQLSPFGEPTLDAELRESLFALATLAFQAKRKTLSNSLANGLRWPKHTLAMELERNGIDPMRRPQSLSVSEWRQLASGPLGRQQ